MTVDLAKRIAELEAATGPDRILDALIECEIRKQQAYALGLSDKVRSHWNPIGTKGEVICTQGITRYHAPMYSFSIDAAMTLVPAGAAWSVNYPANDDGSRSVFGYPSRCHAWVEGGPDAKVYAKTPALALCIAALKARSATGGGNG